MFLRRCSGVSWPCGGWTACSIMRGAPPQVVSIGLARACRERQHVAKLLNERLRDAGSAPPLNRDSPLFSDTQAPADRAQPALEHVNPTPGITGLMLVARETSRWHGEQEDLFEPREPGDNEALGCLIDRLAGRLGYEAVVRPRLLDDHSTRAGVPLRKGRKWRRKSRKSGQSPIFSLECTENRQLSPFSAGAAAFTAGTDPCHCAWCPTDRRRGFSYYGQEYGIVHAAGPERLETAWWRGPDVRRDYFRVTAETGEQFWIFRAAEDRQWYLHGIFA